MNLLLWYEVQFKETFTLKKIMATLKKYYFLIFSIFVSFSCSSYEEESNNYDQIVTKYTEIKEFISEEVNDTFYIYVRLPKYYHEENKRYPVLFLLDGDISFNMATSIVRYLQFGREVPDLIIVAPGYGTLLSDTEVNYRERDYTISNIDRFEGSGGAENYIGFLKNELMPFVDSSYRTNGKRVINGYSLGGLFTINLLLEENVMFDGYIAGSPYITDDLKYLREKIEKFSTLQENKKIFVSVGEFEDEERYHKPINTIVEDLLQIDGLSLSFKVFNEATHFSSPSQALTYGLKFIFSNNFMEHD